MRIIGLCGRSGSGKSVFCDAAKKAGFTVFDCDSIYHSLVSSPTPCLEEIGNEFGSKLVKGGTLNRRALAEIVFGDRNKLEKLNEITFKFVVSEIESRIDTTGDCTYVLDAPALFESGLDARCDLIVSIVASDEKSIERIMRRDAITAPEAAARLAAQRPNDYFIDNSDIILYNEGSLESFIADCESVIATI